MSGEFSKRLDNVESRQSVMAKEQSLMEQNQKSMARRLDTLEQDLQLPLRQNPSEASQENQTCMKEDIEQNADQPYSMPTLQPQDGNLIILDDNQLQAILHNCSDNAMRGRFGNVYTTKNKVPGLGIRVAIKKIVCGKEDKYELLSTANEMIASRIMHFATVPLNAYIDKELEDGHREFYFITPFLENGNLLECIARDAQRPGEILNKINRKKILYHIASALDYLHTEVPGLRGSILHVDISSNNVVLDTFWNARLIDFGLACELKENQNSKTCTRQYGKDGYCYSSNISKWRTDNDYHNYGVVIREMLTGQKPKDGKNELKKLHTKDVEHSLQRSVWKAGDDDVEILLTLSEKCIESVQKDKEKIKSVDIVKILHNILKMSEKFTVDPEGSVQNRKCQNCMVNKAVTGLNSVQSKCGFGINVCVSCMRNSHLNPIMCPYCSEGTIFPKTGHTFAALLIAGNDTRERSYAISFKEEIIDIYDVLVSKWPCVIGIREANVKIVAPASPGDEEELLRKFDIAVNELKAKQGLETLIVYFTGHHDEKGFRLGKEGEYINRDYFRNALKKICQNWDNSGTRVIAFLDCCNPSRIEDMATDKDITLIQISVCSPLSACFQPESGSLFKTFFIQALTRKSFNKKCKSMRNATEECDKCSINGDFVSVHSLHTYIAEHMGMKISAEDQQPHKYENGIKATDAILAYNVDFAINPTVWFEDERGDRKRVCVSPNVYPNIETLKEHIFENILSDQKDDEKRACTKFIHEKFADVFFIRVNEVAIDGKELKSMLELSSAMIGKREIVVSYRQVEQIQNGRTVIFGQCCFVQKLIYGNKSEGKEIETLVFESIDKLDVLVSKLNSLELGDSDNDVRNLTARFKEVTKIWRDDIKQNKTGKELTICFSEDHDLMVLELAEPKQE